MKGGLVALFLAIVALIGLAAPTSAQSFWPVTKFEVCFADPDTFQLDLRPHLCAGDPELAKTIETYMAEVGAELRRQGFPPPRLEPVVDTDAGPAFRIYVFDAPETKSQANHSNPCAGASAYIYLDLVRHDGGALFDVTKLTNKGHADIAHELFHAAQAAYWLFSETCHTGEWLREGSAQAWGKDIALKLRGVPRDAANRPTEIWDARRYDLPLYVEEGTSLAYNTGSFWRFLGEEYAARQSGGRASAIELEPDYVYLRHLYRRPFSGTPDKQREYVWLDEGLREVFGRGLGSLYAQFAGNFAGFVPARERNKDPARRDRWLDFLFDTCPEIILSADQPVIRTEYRIDAMSSRCIKIAPSPLGAADVSVQAFSEGRVALEDISVSVAGDGRMARGTVVDLPGGLSIAGFTVPLDLSRQQVLILSHAPVNPGRVAQIRLPVAYSISTHRSNLPAAPAPDAPEGAPDLGRAADANTDTMTGSANMPEDTATTADALALSPGRVAGNSVNRDASARPCAQPFIFEACGPSTALRFALLPGQNSSVDAVAGVGGLLGQTTANLEGMARVYARNPDHTEALRAQMQEGRGAEISIRMPLIDYGFEGGFSNARIVVTMADGRGLEAVGPADVEPGPARRFPLSGNVTIEEFTPLLMRGRFTAALVAMGERGTEDDPVLPVVHDLEGHFVISQPWRNDRRARLSNDRGSAAEAVAEAFPGLRLVPRASALNGGQAVEPGTAATSTAASCNCSCNYVGSVSAACRPQCAPVLAACSPDIPSPVDSASHSSEAQNAQADELEAAFVEALRLSGSSEAAIAMQLEMFRALPDAAKPMFLESVTPK